MKPYKSFPKKVCSGGYACTGWYVIQHAFSNKYDGDKDSVVQFRFTYVKGEMEIKDDILVFDIEIVQMYKVK